MKFIFPWNNKRSPIAISFWIVVLNTLEKKHYIRLTEKNCQLVLISSGSNKMCPMASQIGK